MIQCDVQMQPWQMQVLTDMQNNIYFTMNGSKHMNNKKK